MSKDIFPTFRMKIHIETSSHRCVCYSISVFIFRTKTILLKPCINITSMTLWGKSLRLIHSACLRTEFHTVDTHHKYRLLPSLLKAEQSYIHPHTNQALICRLKSLFWFQIGKLPNDLTKKILTRQKGMAQEITVSFTKSRKQRYINRIFSLFVTQFL